MKLARSCSLLLLLWLSFAINAQSREINAGEARISRDGVIAGRLDAENPRDVFYIDGLRGEVIGFELSTTAGNLDPVLGVFDNTGQIEMYQDDSGGSLDIERDLTITNSGRYFVVVGRFGYDLGATAGNYELRMTRKGVLSERGSALRYGDSVIGTISEADSEVYYTFQAAQGDIVNISMVRSSGTLDPVLQVVDGDRFEIARNDDQIGADTRNSRVDALIIGRSGTYIIIATRYGESSGSFVLTIEEAAHSGAGSTRQASLPIHYGETLNSTLSHGQFERFYAFDADEGDLITIDMERGGSGDLDTFVTLADFNFTTIIDDDDSGGDQDARIADFRVPADGRYHIIASRFEGRNGKTSGEYRLRLSIADDLVVEAPAGVTSLNYGTSIAGKISADNEIDLYAFYGRRGEVVSISMTRVDGNLDAYLQLLNSAQEVVTSNDDSGANQNALIGNFAVPATGMYYIRARRFFGNDGNSDTAGSYVLVLAERHT